MSPLHPAEQLQLWLPPLGLHEPCPPHGSPSQPVPRPHRVPLYPASQSHVCSCLSRHLPNSPHPPSWSAPAHAHSASLSKLTSGPYPSSQRHFFLVPVVSGHGERERVAGRCTRQRITLSFHRRGAPASRPRHGPPRARSVSTLAACRAHPFVPAMAGWVATDFAARFSLIPLESNPAFILHCMPDESSPITHVTTEERSFGQSCNAQILIWQTILHLETQLLYESFLAESQPQMSDACAGDS